jgi:hypothetical protein
MEALLSLPKLRLPAISFASRKAGVEGLRKTRHTGTARAVAGYQSAQRHGAGVGCSHPGIDKIVEAASTIDPRIHLIVGGFHLVVASDADIQKIVTTLHDMFNVQYVAPGHCTGEPAFTALKGASGDRYLFAGLGTTFALNTSPN